MLECKVELSSLTNDDLDYIINNFVDIINRL